MERNNISDWTTQRFDEGQPLEGNLEGTRPTATTRDTRERPTPRDSGTPQAFGSWLRVGQSFGTPRRRVPGVALLERNTLEMGLTHLRDPRARLWPTLEPPLSEAVSLTNWDASSLKAVWDHGGTLLEPSLEPSACRDLAEGPSRALEKVGTPVVWWQTFWDTTGRWSRRPSVAQTRNGTPLARRNWCGRRPGPPRALQGPSNRLGHLWFDGKGFGTRWDAGAAVRVWPKLEMGHLWPSETGAAVGLDHRGPFKGP